MTSRLAALSWILLGAFAPTPANAAGDQAKVRIACSLKGILAAIHNPWANAAVEAGVADLRPAGRLSQSIVVANLWRYRGEGSALAALARDVPRLREAGVQTIYFPPMFEQMLHDFFGSPNDHGYWPKNWDIGRIDPKLGTPEELRTALSRIREAGMTTAIDVVPRHTGYPPADGWVELWGKRVHVTDPEYFRQSPEPSAKDLATVELMGPSQMHVYTDYRMWGLPALDTSKPEVRSRLIADHRRIAAAGFDVFRIDSAKHMRPDFVRDLMNNMAEVVEGRGGKPHFILEYFSGNYGELAYYATRLGDVPGMHFIDFRMAGAVRQSVIDGASFDVIRTAAREPEKLGFSRSHLVQAMTDQDKFFPPTYHGDADSANQTFALIAVSHLTSDNRPYAVAGLEQPVPRGTKTSEPAAFWDASSPIQEQVGRLNRLFNDQFPRLAPFLSDQVLRADGSALVIKRPYASGKGHLALVVDRSRSSQHIQRFLADNSASAPRVLFRWGEHGGVVETALIQLDR